MVFIFPDSPILSDCCGCSLCSWYLDARSWPVSIHFDVTMFYYTFTFIASIIGCLLLQGVVPTEENGGGNPFTFQTLGNAFVAMYTISSTENWTAIVYNAIQFTDSSFAQACIGVFFCAWLVMSNFVTINMFIAVLYENLELSIMSKRMEQIFIF